MSSYPTTYARVLRYLNTTEATSPSAEEIAQYAAYDNWIATAYDVIANYCNQPILRVTGKEFYFSFGDLTKNGVGYYQNLPVVKIPVTITSISRRESVFDSWTTEDTSNYVLIVEHGITRVYFLDTHSNEVGKIVASAGYLEASMPEVIYTIVCEMVSVMVDESKQGKGRLAVETEAKQLPGGGSLNTKFISLTSKHEQLLTPYKVTLP